VEAQVRHVALAVKAGSAVSDLRRHRFGGRLARARLVYFRAATAGACTYFDDRRDGALPQGACWTAVSDDLQARLTLAHALSSGAAAVTRPRVGPPSFSQDCSCMWYCLQSSSPSQPLSHTAVVWFPQ